MLKEYIESLFVELFESRVRDRLDSAQLRASIQDYVDSQRRVFESCIPDEELDYEGLTQYLRDEILSEIELRIFAPSRDERGRAYASVYSKAIAYAHANTKLQKANVRKFVNAVLDILNNFYEQKITPLQRYMRTVTVDTMLAGTEKQHEVQTQDVIMGVQQVLRTEMIRNPLSIDENVALMQAGNITQVEDNLALLQRTISATHVLAPDYGFIMRRVGGKEHLVSTPLTDDAHRLHPPLFKIQGQVYIGTEAAPSLTQDLVKYADDHQLPITIDIEDAHKYLGDIVDPIQIEAEELRGHKLVRQPKPFPEAQAYCVVIDGVVVCETLYLRIAEKNEDGTIVYSNQGNPYPFSIRFTVDPLQASTEFSFSYEGKDHTMHLFYYEFLKSYHAGQRISFRNLETGDTLLEVSNRYVKDETYEAKIDLHIALLKKLMVVEKYFSVVFELPELISHDDIHYMFYLADLIEGGVQRKWSRFEVPLRIGENTKTRLLKAADEPSSFSELTAMRISIFGQVITCPLIRTMQCARLADVEKTLKKLEAFDVGDTIRLVFLPDGVDGDVLYERTFVDEKGEYATFLREYTVGDS